MKSQKKYSVVIDTTGLRCPVRLLNVQKNITLLRKNPEALIITDDPMAELDLNHFCLNNNYSIKKIKNYKGGNAQFFLIKKDQ